MSRVTIRIAAAAREELRWAVGRYDQERPELGDEFSVEMERCVGRLAEHPEIGSPYLAGTRRVVAHRFPFSVVYRLRGSEVEVIAFAHHRRKPGYWRERI